MMTRTRIHLWITLLCIGLVGIFSLPVSAQEDPITASNAAFNAISCLTGKMVYVAGRYGWHDHRHLFKVQSTMTTIPAPTSKSPTSPIRQGINERNPQFSLDGEHIGYLGEADPTTYPEVMSLFVVNLVSRGQCANHAERRQRDNLRFFARFDAACI